MTTTGDLETPGMTPPAAPAPVVPPKKNVFQRIAGVLFAPAETFEEIARRPDIVGPLIVVILISFITTAMIVPRMDFDTMMREQMAQQGREIDDQGMKVATAFAKALAYTSPLWGIIAYLVVAGVLLLAFRLFGGEGNYVQALSTTIYAWMPMTLKGIVMAIVAMARENVDPQTIGTTLVKSNPAFLVDMKEQPVLFALLTSFDVFSIWSLVLMIIGFAALSKVSRKKAAAIVISLWAVVIVFKMGMAAMGAAFAKKS